MSVKAAWRGQLCTDAQKLIDSVEQKLGSLPPSLSTALEAKAKTTQKTLSVEEVEQILTKSDLSAEQRTALKSVSLGTPDLSHNGNPNFVGSLAQAMQNRPPKRRSILARIFGTSNDRTINHAKPIVAEIGSFEAKVSKLNDEQLKAKTADFKERVKAGESLDAILPEAFACAREVGKRVLSMRHYDTQVLGGILLHQGKIAEMVTGEGKTLVATLPSYLNALNGKGVHVITVNDYLAKRDTQWMGPLYHALGMKVGVLQNDGSAFVFDPDYQAEDPRMSNLRPVPRRDAYNADITYGTNTEFGFDYLRDNIAPTLDHTVQRKPSFAIVDEVDNILIDEARTPMIISGPSPSDPTQLCQRVDNVIRNLDLGVVKAANEDLFEVEKRHPEADFIVDQKYRRAYLTEVGTAKVERLLGIENLYEEMDPLHRVQQALVAHSVFERDKDYMVENGEVVIVDEHTGRPARGRRWSNGLHQAIEAKEGVDIAREDLTIASVTVQNYFRMYEKLAGMTGTASTDAEELNKTYKLDVVTLPTNKPMNRISFPDSIFATKAEKDQAILSEITMCCETGRPVLVGTTSIEESEELSKQLDKLDIPHRVLNAKEHEHEAEIIAQSGRHKAVTIATNMAGRGTDIVLGGNANAMATDAVRDGNVDKEGIDPELYQKTLDEVRTKQSYGLLDTPDPEAYSAALIRAREQTSKEKEKVLALGGLHIIGTTRYESRRIDDQLLGRAGRQGDPGSSRFFLSLEDDLMRLFGNTSLSLLSRVMKKNEPLESSQVEKAVRDAQKKVEGYHYDVRKHLLKYDDVMSKQREIIYADRKKVMETEDLREVVRGIISEVVDNLINAYTMEYELIGHGMKDLAEAIEDQFNLKFTPEEMKKLGTDGLRERLRQDALAAHEEKEKELSPDVMRQLERELLRQSVDAEWQGHLIDLDQLKEGIGLRAYGQKDPLLEFKQESFDLFENLIKRIGAHAVSSLFEAAA